METASLLPYMRPVVRCIVDGLTEKEVATRLRVQPSSVNKYVGRIYDRLGIHSRLELYKWAQAHPEEIAETASI